AIVPCIIFFLFIGATSFLIRRLSEKTKNGAIVFLLVAVSIFSISVFKWHWYWRSGGQSEAEPALVSEQRKKLVVDVAQEIASQRKGDTTVFFTTITQYFNADILNFEFLRRRYRGLEATDAAFLDQLELIKPSLDSARFVVTFSDDNPEVLRWLPSAAILQAQNEAIGRSDLKLINTFPSPSGVGTIMLYGRRSP